MSRITHQTPMDFEFQNGTGPIDGRSPFAQVGANAQRFPAGADSSKKRPFSMFDSPTKPRAMAQQSPSTKPLPPPPAFNSLFNTPRKPRDDYDDSSAGETPKSPEQRNRSDATPEATTLRSASSRFDAQSAPTLSSGRREERSPPKERPRIPKRDGFIVKIKNKLYSPGRGEVPRADHSNAMEKRVTKRRRRDIDRQVARRRRHSMSDSGRDEEEAPVKSRKASGERAPDLSGQRTHWISELFTFIGKHPTVPHILSYYAQFLFNVFLLCGIGYLLYRFVSAVQGDVDKKAFEVMTDVLAESAACARLYRNNGCDASRMPALEDACDNWAKCMNRDASKVARGRVGAITLMEIYNSFVEPMSWKTMIFTFVLIGGSFGLSNFGFSVLRDRTQQYQSNYGYGGPPPPPTPNRSFSGQDGGFYAGHPWYQSPAGISFEPQPSGGFDQIEGRGSPVRRLAYN